MADSKSFIGLPVICSQNDKKIGRINDMIISLGNSEIIGFLINTGTLFETKKFLRAKDIKYADKTCIKIDSPKLLKPFFKKHTTFLTVSELCGKDIYDISGNELGRIYDVETSDELSFVSDIIISRGVACDIAKGRRKTDYRDVIFNAENNKYFTVNFKCEEVYKKHE